MKKQLGVTLIELMITMAVIAVISAIAIPMYTDYMTTAKLMEGKNGLASLKMAQEEYFLENNGYFPPGDTSVTTASGLSAYWTPEEGSNRQFDYTVATSNSSMNYVLTATGRGLQVPTTVSFSLGN